MEETTEKKGVDLTLKNVPVALVSALERRAARNFRARHGEILAILTAVCLGDATLPGLGIGECLPERGA